MQRLWDGEEVTHHGRVDIERVFVHNVNTNQAAFVGAFGENVVPELE